jgi:hypothetical protein
MRYAGGKRTPAPASTPAAPKSGPRCHCGTPITHTPGKRLRVYCSNACKQRAKRAIAAGRQLPHPGRKVAGESPATHNVSLGTESTEFRTPLNGTTSDGGPGESEGAERPSEQTPAELARRATAKARKSQRYAGRRTLWRVTGDKACKGCGRNLLDPDSGALVVQTAEGDSVVLGTMKCARIWFCPVCSAKIRQKRAEEITRAVVTWIQAGGTAYLVSLTARHDYRDELADLMDAIQGTRAGTEVEIASARQAKAAAKDAYAEACRRAREEARATVDAARIAAPKGKKREAMAEAREDAAKVLADRIAAAEVPVKEAAAKLAGTARQAGAFQRLITGGTWAGDKREKASAEAAEGIRDRIGYIGMIRATEVTVGMANLWHPHIHAIVLVGGRTEGERANKRVVKVFEPSESALEEWEDHWRATWTNHLERVNPKYRPSDECGIPDCKCDGKGHGVDFKRLETVRDAKQLGEYISKTQDGKSPALELARGDLKTGREGNMTPFEVLYRLGDLIGGVPEEDAPGQGSKEWCLHVWHEYEKAVTGRRAIEWTRHLRPLLGVEGDDTEEGDLDLLLGVDGELGEYRGGAHVTDEGWTALNRRGLDLAAEEAGEGKDVSTDPTSVAARLQPLLDAAKAPAGSVRPLTAGEVSDTYAAILERTAQRREDARTRRKREAERDRERSQD